MTKRVSSTRGGCKVRVRCQRQGGVNDKGRYVYRCTYVNIYGLSSSITITGSLWRLPKSRREPPKWVPFREAEKTENGRGWRLLVAQREEYRVQSCQPKERRFDKSVIRRGTVQVVPCLSLPNKPCDKKL